MHCLLLADWKALILVLINLLIAIVLYYPFFKKYEREMLAQEQSLNEDSAEKNRMGDLLWKIKMKQRYLKLLHMEKCEKFSL